MSSIKRKIFQDVSYYSASSFAAQMIGVFGAILCRYFLGPVQMGMWSALQIVMSMSSYVTLGTTAAINVEMPYQIGKKDPGKAEIIKDIVFVYLLSALTFCALAIIGYAFLMRNQLSNELFYGLILIAWIIVLQKMNNYFITLLRAHKDFKLAGKQMIFSAMLNLFLVALLTYRYKIYGFICANGLSLIFNLAYIYWHKRYRFRFHMDWKSLGGLIRLGFPLMMIGLMGTLFKSIDKIMILKYLGFEAMGFYSIAVLVISSLTGIYISIGVVLLPHFQEKYGSRDDEGDLKKYVVQSAVSYTDLFPILIGLSWILTPMLAYLFLKDYVEGIRAAQYLSLSVYFLGISNIYGNHLVTIRKHMILFPLIAAAGILSIGSNALAIAWGFGIDGIAIATTVAAIIYASALYMYSMKSFKSPAQMLSAYALIVGKFLWMVGALLIIDYWILRGPWHWMKSVSAGFLYLVLCAPFILNLLREYEILNFLKNKFVLKRFIHGKA